MGKDYKQFDFNSKEDYLFLFYNLISRAYQLFRRFKIYRRELEKYVLSIEDSHVMYIDDMIHSEWHDKILSVTRGLITVFVDEVKGGISYVKLRKMISKTEYHLKQLDSKTKDELEELRDVRNWSYHLPQTDFVAMKEVFLKNVPNELHKYIVYDFNPIKVGIADKCSIAVMESLLVHTQKREAIFQNILNCMIKDFETMLGENTEIIEVPEKPLELLGESMAAAQLSMAMNKRKYDGKNETYEKITFQKPLNDE